MSLTSGANLNVVKTALDDVFYQQFNPERHPGWVGAESSMIFNQDTTTKAAEIEEVFKGVGLWDSREELEDVVGATPQVTNKVTYNVVSYAKSIDISKRFFDRLLMVFA